jgi:hypothetical protein
MSNQRIRYRDIAISGLALLLLYYFLPGYAILYFGLVYLVLCLYVEPVRELNHAFWLSFTRVMQRVMNPLLFGAIFLVVLLPVGLLYRLFKRKKSAIKSNFVVVEQRNDPELFEVSW